MRENICALVITMTFLVVVAPAQTADPTGATLWTSASFKELGVALAPKMDETKGANQQMLTQNTYNALFFHREGSAEPEIHEKLADFMVVESGEGEIQVGGQLTGGKPIAPNEIRGTELNGGIKYKLKTGDILYIPANTPHRTIVETGKQLNVMVIKAQP